MYSMMNTTGDLGYSIYTGWALHWAFGTFWIIGAILFVAWAIKNLNGTMLRNWAIGLFVVGILGAIVTAPADIAVWRTILGGKNNMMQGDTMGRMMQMMMKHDQGSSDGEGEEHGNMMQMMRMMMRESGGDFAGTDQDEHHESSSSIR